MPRRCMRSTLCWATGDSCCTALNSFSSTDRSVGTAATLNSAGSAGSWGWRPPRSGPGGFGFAGCSAADPWRVTERGYPEILQSGESFDGVPLHDRQHPHDLFMELAAIYETPVSHGVGLELYAAPVGEPAVGPVAFPHRPSASSDPFAPLSHHWQ